MDAVAKIWEKMAMSLGFDEANINTIRKSCFGQPQDASREMFSQWLEGVNCDLKPATWSTLVQSLKDVNLRNIAGVLRNLVC